MSEKEEMVLYDGFEFQKIISEFIPVNESKIDTLDLLRN